MNLKDRPLGWLVFGWIAGLIIGFSVSRAIFGYWLWEKSTTVAIINVVVTIIALTIFWWWIWKPGKSKYERTH